MLEIFRVQKVSGAGTGDAESQGFFGKHHVHKPTGRMQVSSFSFLGSQQYRLIWGEAVCAPVARLEEKFARLRWVGMRGTAIALAKPKAAYWRRIPLEMAAAGASSTGSSYRVYRRAVREQLAPEANLVGVGVRQARTQGVAQAAALYGPAAGSRAVRWVGHANKHASGARAESFAGIPRRIIPVRVPHQFGEVVTDMTAVRQRLAQSLDTGRANSLNLIEPVRIAILQGVGTGFATAAKREDRLAIYHVVRMRGITHGTAGTTGQGLKEVMVRTPPAMEGNAALFRAIFKINADSPAPYTRQIIVPYVDRRLAVPATHREYRV